MQDAALRPDPIEYMAMVASTAPGSAYKSRVLRQLDLHPGHVVIDVGCGPGTDLSAMHSAVRDGGVVLGVDVDQRMLHAARDRTIDIPGVAVVAGDAHSLPICDGVVDRVRTDRSLQHMARPARVLTEFHRILRPGGIAVLAEPDWGTLVIDCSIDATSRSFVDYICREVVRNPLIGRQAGRLSRQAGFADHDVHIAPAVFHDFVTADTVLGLSRNAMRASRDGYLSTVQADQWLAALRTEAMLVSVNLFVTTLITGSRAPTRD